MYEGSIVIKKPVSGPKDWSCFNEYFPQAAPIPFLEAVNLLKANQRNVSQMVIVGKVHRRWPFYHDITGGCGNGNGDRRIRFLLSDELEIDNHCFYVTCFGRCAVELEKAGLAVNQIMQIWKPNITEKRWQPFEKIDAEEQGDVICDYEIWFGLEDEDINVNYEKRIAVYSVNVEQNSNNEAEPISSDQNVPLESLSDQPPVKQPKLVTKENINEESINQTTFQDIAKARLKSSAVSGVEVQEYDNYTYSQIDECISIEKSVKYNLYAIVTNVRREPTPTKNNIKLMSQVYITDPSCQGTYGFSDFQFSLLGHNEDDFPKIILGSIIRIHHMSVQLYQGFRNGRVFDARSVTVVGHSEKDLSHEDCKPLNKRDELKVKELVEWWDKEGRDKQSQSQELKENENYTEFREITPSTKLLNIKCTVLEQVSTNITRCKILRVTDNTKSNLPIVLQDEDGITLKSETNSSIHDIFVVEHLDLLRLAKAGKNVSLSGIQCLSTTLKSESITSYKLIINSNAKADCHVISTTKQTAVNPEHGSLDDSEFDRMLANAIRLPSTEEGSSADIINKDHVADANILCDIMNNQERPSCSKEDNLGKTVDSEDLSVPIFPVNSGPLIVRPCESTDESLDTDKNNENQKPDEHKELPKTDDMPLSRDRDIMKEFKNPCMTTDVSFETLVQLEKSICGSAEICNLSNDDISRQRKQDPPDSMQVFTGSQVLSDALDDTGSSNMHNESGGIAPTIGSISPSSKRSFAIRSSSNFPLITSVSEAKNKRASEKFRIVGYVKEFQPNMLRCRNNLILMHSLCKNCCTSIPLLQLEQFKDQSKYVMQTPTCVMCNELMDLYIFLKMVISDSKVSQPLQLPDSAQDAELEVILCGINAEYLFSISSHNYLFSKDVQDQVLEHLMNIVGQRVELSVVAIEDSSKREYRIIDSYISANDDNYI